LRYPDDELSPTDKIANVMTDCFFLSGVRRVASIVSNQNIPVWQYLFTYDGHWVENAFLGIFHGSELEYLFANPTAILNSLLPKPLVHNFRPQHKYIQNVFGNYWSGMLHYGNPNGDDDRMHHEDPPYWPSFNDTDQIHLVIDHPVREEKFPNSTLLDFWDDYISWKK